MHTVGPAQQRAVPRSSCRQSSAAGSSSAAAAPAAQQPLTFSSIFKTFSASTWS
jgi:hypothetical protein